MAERSRDADHGFTLVEVVVVVVLLGLISLVIGFAITTVLRVTPVAESQVTNARSIQGLTAWFADDAASAVASSSTSVTPNPPSPLKCANSEATSGVNLVEFEWTVDETSPTTFVAAYRIEPDGSGHTVHRYACSGSGTPPYSGTTAQKLTGPLANFNNVTWTTSPPRIELDLRALDGTAIGLEATPRSPADSLPATSVPATVPPPTPCAVTLDPPTYAPTVGRVPSGTLVEKLAADVDPNFDLSGDSCGVLTIEYDTGYEVRSREITVFWPNGAVTIPQGNFDNDPVTGTPRWTTGSKMIEIFNNGAPLDTPTTFVLEVTS